MRMHQAKSLSIAILIMLVIIGCTSGHRYVKVAGHQEAADNTIKSTQYRLPQAVESQNGEDPALPQEVTVAAATFGKDYQSVQDMFRDRADYTTPVDDADLNETQTSKSTEISPDETDRVTPSDAKEKTEADDEPSKEPAESKQPPKAMQPTVKSRKREPNVPKGSKGIKFSNIPVKDVIEKFNEILGEDYQLSDEVDAQRLIEWEYKSNRELVLEDYKKLFERFLEDNNYQVRSEEGIGKIYYAFALNFENADLSLVIQTLSELIGLDYILHPGVGAGKRINMQTWNKKILTKKELTDLLYTLLELNNATMIKSGEYWKIIPMSEVKSRPLDVRIPQQILDEYELQQKLRDSEQLPDSDQMVMQVIPLQYISTAQATQFIRPLLSNNSSVISSNDTNLLIIIEVASNLNKILKVLELLDVDLGVTDFVLIPIQYADASDIANVLNQIFRARTTTVTIPSRTTSRTSRYRSRRAPATTTTTSGSEVIIIPDKRSNSLIIFASKRDIEFAKQIISMLDVDIYATRKTYIYYCENAKAEDLAKILSQVYGKGGRGEGQKSPVFRGRQPQPGAKQGEAAGEEVEGEITIVPDERTNSLIIVASPTDYDILLGTLKKLDIQSKQVLLDILYAEIKLDKSNQFGVRWELLSQGKLTVGNTTYYFDDVMNQDFSAVPKYGEVGSGFTLNLFEASRFRAILNTISADNKLKVLSNPYLLASNNTESKIEIGDQVPIIVGETTTGSITVQPGTNQPSQTFTQNVQYRDTGIILTITPHINENRFVTLEIQQEISEVTQEQFGGTRNPAIQKRNINTTVVVKDAMSLILGGLIRTKKSTSKSGLPLLSDIPLLGPLFSSLTRRNETVELLMVITPRVIGDPQEAIMATDMIWDNAISIKRYYKDNRDRFLQH